MYQTLTNIPCTKQCWSTICYALMMSVRWRMSVCIDWQHGADGKKNENHGPKLITGSW